jgi:hypothetical protein
VLVEAGNNHINRINSTIARERVEEVLLLAVDVFCAVVVEVVHAVGMIVTVTVTVTVVAASGCWFVAVVLESAPLIVLVKSILSAPSKKRQLQSLRPLPVPVPVPLLLLLLLPLLVVTCHQRLVPVLHQRSLVRQSLLHFK